MRFERRHEKKLQAAIRHGWQLLREDRHQENLEFLEDARRQFPGEAEIQLLYGTTLLAIRPDDVAVEVRKAAELAPDDPSILVRAASLMLDRGHPDAARSYTKRAREVAEPGFGLEGGLANLEGVFAGFDKEYERAEERLRLAVEIDPEFDRFARDLALLLKARGRRKEALEVVDRALPRVEKKARLERLRKELVDQAGSASSGG